MVASIAAGLIVMNLTGGLHEKHAAETWKLGTVSVFFEDGSNRGNFCRCCRSQNLQQSNRLRSISPANNGLCTFEFLNVSV